MARYTITVPDKIAQGLIDVVARYNANNGAALTVTAWLELHTRELAASDAIAAETQRRTSEAEAALQAALLSFRADLLADNP